MTAQSVHVREHPLRVVLIHGHDLVRRGLRMILNSDVQLEVVAETGDAEAAHAILLREAPDVVVIGGSLPAGASAALCQFVLDELPGAGRLILPAAEDDDAILAGVSSGAAVCLPHLMQGADLTDAVHRVAAGQIFLDPVVTRRVLDLIINPTDRTQEDIVEAMSPRERQVLTGLGEGLSNREIAARLGLAEKTDKNYVSTVFAKLGLRRRAQAAALAAGMLPLG